MKLSGGSGKVASREEVARAVYKGDRQYGSMMAAVVRQVDREREVDLAVRAGFWTLWGSQVSRMLSGLANGRYCLHDIEREAVCRAWREQHA